MDKTPRPATSAQNDVTLSIVPPLGKEMRAVGQLGVDRIAPDGSAVLFQTSDRRFYVRRLNSPDAQPLPQFQPSNDAFWSPDSKSIAVGRQNTVGAPLPLVITTDL
jgi:hypothetical protein